MLNADKFSTDYFKDALRQQIEKNREFLTPVQAMNSYYHSVVSAIIQDHLNKNFELVRRIRNLDEAYQAVKAESKQQA
ncbi:protein YvfG [Terrilactibacillus sp. S3-3]|nr:protein YvfG [Terrilactibacillus sp. S3-3]